MWKSLNVKFVIKDSQWPTTLPDITVQFIKKRQHSIPTTIVVNQPSTTLLRATTSPLTASPPLPPSSTTTTSTSAPGLKYRTSFRVWKKTLNVRFATVWWRHTSSGSGMWPTNMEDVKNTFVPIDIAKIISNIWTCYLITLKNTKILKRNQVQETYDAPNAIKNSVDPGHSKDTGSFTTKKKEYSVHSAQHSIASKYSTEWMHSKNI